MNLAGSICLVTGGSSGIGRAAALALSARGAHVVAAGRDETALRAAAAAAGGRWLAADLVAPGAVQRLARDAEAAFGRIDILVNNAGLGWAGPFERMEPGDAATLLEVNLAAPVALTRALLPAMLERGRGWIVNVASIAGHVGVRDEAVYSATKAGLIAFGEALRWELAGRGVGVTVVSPGVVRTPFFERRGRPYDRARPRPVPAESVGEAIATAIERGRPEVFVPGWMGGVARLRGAAPATFRRLARRFG